MENASGMLSVDNQTLILLIMAALATYATRIGGYILMSSMKRIPPRVESALNAVPAAVLTTLVAPPFVNGGWDVRIAMVVAFVVCLRFPGLTILAAGWAAVMILRHGVGLGL